MGDGDSNLVEASAQLLAEVRSLAECPSCGRLCREPRALEPCLHTVCQRCLPGGSWEPATPAAATRARIRCPVCRTPCSVDAPHRSLAALADLLSLWPPPAAATDARLSLAALQRRLRARHPRDRLRPSAVVHFPGPPHSFQSWPATAGGGGVAAVIRDVNNQRVWAAAPAKDGETAKPVLVPDLGEEEYTISGFCLARPTGRCGNGGVEGASKSWLAVLSDFYRDRLLVCSLDGRCHQRLSGIPRPSAICADCDGECNGEGECVFALTKNGAELRAFRWRRRRLVPVSGDGDGDDNGDGNGEQSVFRHPRLRYGRAIAVGAGRVCIADSTSGCVLIVDRRRLLDSRRHSGDLGLTEFTFGDSATALSPPMALAVAACCDGDGIEGCVFVNSVGANGRKCVAVCDLATGRRLAELPCGFACACGCPSCVDGGNDADIGALCFDPGSGRLLVGRRARASHALVFSLIEEADGGEDLGDLKG